MKTLFITTNVPDCTEDEELSFFGDRFCSAKTDDVVDSSFTSFDRC